MVHKKEHIIKMKSTIGSNKEKDRLNFNFLEFQMQITPKKASMVLVTANLNGNESNNKITKTKAKLF